MPKVLMLKGLPGSGKSTRARELVADQGFVHVNKDDLRAMLHNGRHSKGRERQVLGVRDFVVESALRDGKNVVVDDTNFNPVHEEQLRQLAHDRGASFSVEFMDTPIEECIRRDLLRPNSVGERVIRQMYDQYLKPAPAPAPAWNPDLPTAIICDIDGTLSHMVEGGRSPYDWPRVGEDTLDDSVSWLLSRADCKIVLLSGRDAVCRSETEAWLQGHGIAHDALFMRAAGDMRKDSIVKEELYREHIEGRYNVRFVMDDRQQVVDQWRALGLKCFQVAPGDF